MAENKKFSRNKQEKISLIYDTFFKLILKYGYHKTSTNHIAKSAKISIGTIYNYFPKGKENILKNYFEESMEDFLESQNLNELKGENIKNFFDHFVQDLLRNHEENRGYHLAFRSAIQSDKKLQEAHNEKVHMFFKEKVQELRKTNEQLQRFPEKKLVNSFVFLYNLMNAILYHHLSVMKLFDTKEEFVEYLSDIVAFSLEYYLKV